MRKIDGQYQPSWMVVRVKKTDPRPLSVRLEPMFTGSLLADDLLTRFGSHSFDPIMNEDDWIMWSNRNSIEDEAERLFEND